MKEKAEAKKKAKEAAGGGKKEKVEKDDDGINPLFANALRKKVTDTVIKMNEENKIQVEFQSPGLVSKTKTDPPKEPKQN